jgi:hypothetical protein
LHSTPEILPQLTLNSDFSTVVDKISTDFTDFFHNDLADFERSELENGDSDVPAPRLEWMSTCGQCHFKRDK